MQVQLLNSFNVTKDTKHSVLWWKSRLKHCTYTVYQTLCNLHGQTHSCQIVYVLTRLCLCLFHFYYAQVKFVYKWTNVCLVSHKRDTGKKCKSDHTPFLRRMIRVYTMFTALWYQKELALKKINVCTNEPHHKPSLPNSHRLILFSASKQQEGQPGYKGWF